MKLEKVFDYAERYLINELEVLFERFYNTKDNESKKLLKAKILELENDLIDIKEKNIKKD